MNSPAPNSDEESHKPLPPRVHEIPKGMDLINYVAQCIRMGCDPNDIRKQIIAFGFPEANAEKMVTDTIAWVQKNPYAGNSSSGQSQSVEINGHMIVGIIACVIGIGVTAISYMAAGTSGGSGKYIVAWGAVLFGVVEILRGFGASKK